MNEQFLQYLWKNKLVKTQNIYTQQGNELRIIDFGIENTDAGPDFLNSKVEMDGILWAGNVEIHINESDWYKHNHHKDEKYNNIILHVVYNSDKGNKDTQLSRMPTLVIKDLFDKSIFNNYQSFLLSKSWIPCQKSIINTEDIILLNWLNRLLVERLERKSGEILHYYKYFNNSWQETLYFFISKNFGFKKNNTGFEMLAKSLPYKILSKHRDQVLQLEALLFGQAGFLMKHFSDSYPKKLKNEYQFFRKKYDLQPIDNSIWKFSKLRPANFPTIRIAQLAKVIHISGNIWDMMIKNHNTSSIKKSLSVRASEYWDNHYLFEKSSSHKPKNIGELCVENIIINTITPIMFIYGKHTLDPSLCDNSVNLLTGLKPEKNSIINKWEDIGIKPFNAADTQALIELKKNYCTPKKCLQCSIGNTLLRNYS